MCELIYQPEAEAKALKDSNRGLINFSDLAERSSIISSTLGSKGLYKYIIQIEINVVFGFMPYSPPPENDGESTTFYKAGIQLSLREPEGTDIQVKVLANAQPVYLGISFLFPHFHSC